MFSEKKIGETCDVNNQCPYDSNVEDAGHICDSTTKKCKCKSGYVETNGDSGKLIPTKGISVEGPLDLIWTSIPIQQHAHGTF